VLHSSAILLAGYSFCRKFQGDLTILSSFVGIKQSHSKTGPE